MTTLNANEQARLQRLEAASQWLLRIQDPTRTDAEINDWLSWCDAHPENFAEFQRLQRDWLDLESLKADELVLAPAQKSALLEQKSHHFAGRYSASATLRRGRTWALAAGVAALALAAAFTLNKSVSSRGNGGSGAQQLAAATTNRAATLPDGSKMILGVQSRVNMDFSGPKRQLDLSDGEAYFKVQHDRSRPFVVQAGEVSVTAIGTAFDVRRGDNQVTVTVEEGTVEVSTSVPTGVKPGGGSAVVTWRAEAGYQLTYSTRNHTASLASVNPDTELAWRNGELAYVREPLGSVVENLNRYSTHKIVIADPEVAALPFTGTAFASSLDDWLAGIEQVYPVTAQHTAGGDIILHTAK